MTILIRLTFALVPILALLTACETTRPYAASPPQEQGGIDRNHGYALLYATIESEARVDQVLMIKNPREEVRDLLKEIGDFARQTREMMNEWAEQDDSLGFDEHGLPWVEARTRDAIEQSTGRQIMTAGGRRFEHRILLTQYEALNYIHHLADVLRELDEDEHRLEELDTLAEAVRKLLDRVITLLRAPFVDDESASGRGGPARYGSSMSRESSPGSASSDTSLS